MPHLAHKPPRSKLRQELLLGGLVGGSMLLITGLYALTLRYQDIGTHPEDAPRWSIVADGVITRAAPLKTTLLDVTKKISSISKAHAEQTAAVAALKSKIESGAAASASATTETP